MTPVYFGRPSRRLFGVYHPAVAHTGPVRAALFCNPFGGEYNHAHRAVRKAAVSLAASGMHALRFDYFGTGDSAGDLHEADLDIWDDDISCGIEELRDLSGAPRVTLVGLRLGALLGARTAAALPDMVDRLVLWDPVLEGQAFLDEQFRACYSPHLLGRGLVPRPQAVGGGFEVLGYSVSARMLHEIGKLEIRTFANELPKRSYALLSGNTEDETRMRDALLSSAIDIPVQSFAGNPCWEPVWPDPVAIVPATLIKTLVHVVG